MKTVPATLPLSPENQILYFKDKEVLFEINIGESPITPKQCLMTLSNMQLKVQIADVSPQLLYEYMTGRFIVETTNLAKITANVLLGFKYEEMIYSEVEKYFSIDDYALFIETHQDMIGRWCQVLDSIPLYLMMCSRKIFSNSLLNEIKKKLTVQDKVEGVGVNLSQVVSLSEFLSFFLDEEGIKNSLISPYYSHHFDEYIYGGKNLFAFLSSSENNSDFAILGQALMKCFSEGKVKFTDENKENKRETPK